MTSGRKYTITIDGVTYPSMAAAARALGISKQAVWLRANSRSRRNRPNHVRSRASDPARRLTDEERRALLDDLWALSVRQLAHKYGIATSTVSAYRKRYRRS